MDLFKYSGATISECSKYRYNLWRIWDESKPKVLFIMLNPSTADGNQDDPTIRRCINFAKSWCYGSLYVVNLFAYRATNPKDLLSVEDPIGEQNIGYISKYYTLCEIAICAWGNSKIIDKLGVKFPEYQPLSEIIGPLHYLELANDGTPKHPLYLKSELKPISYTK